MQSAMGGLNNSKLFFRHRRNVIEAVIGKTGDRQQYIFPRKPVLNHHNSGTISRSQIKI
jgi:hypothetical protein